MYIDRNRMVNVRISVRINGNGKKKELLRASEENILNESLAKVGNSDVDLMRRIGSL